MILVPNRTVYVNRSLDDIPTLTEALTPDKIAMVYINTSKFMINKSWLGEHFTRRKQQ